MSAPIEPRKERTRRKLLEVAALRFADGGYHGTSYDDLIAATGLSKGAGYHHFRSKQELALAVYQAKQAELVGQPGTLADGPAPLLEVFFEQLRRRARAFARDASLMCLPRLAADFAKEAELRPEAVARTTFAALVGMTELARRERGSTDQSAETEQLIELLSAALRPARQARPSSTRKSRTRRGLT